MELLPEFCILSRYRIKLFATDELTRGLSDMIKTKEIPVWLTFAMSVFLDIHHLLRSSVERGLMTLHGTGDAGKKILDRHSELSRGLVSPSTWPKQNEDNVRQLSRAVDDCVLKDELFKPKEAIYRQASGIWQGESEHFYLFKRHPILCGIMTFRILLELQQLGITLCNAWGTVVYPAHLYNALKLKNPPVKPWPLMDEVIGIHGEERVFVGGAPKTIMDCYKQVQLMLGYSPEQFSRNRRQYKPVVSKKGPRGLKQSSPIAEIFLAGLASDGSMALTMHNVEELLNEQAQVGELAANPRSKTLRHEWRNSKRLTTLQLLEALQASLPMELRSSISTTSKCMSRASNSYIV